MTKFEIIISKLATLETLSKNNSDTIIEIKKDFKEHDAKYEPFRQMCNGNRIKIKWAIFPSLTILFTALAYLIFFT